MKNVDDAVSVRADKWLWAARFFKTRSLAQDAIELGRVRLAGQRIKPARELRVGDFLQIERAQETYEVYVERLSSVRGPAPQAQTLYRETDASRQHREHAAQIRHFSAEPARTIEKGRPTKRDGRELRRIKDSWI